MVVAWHGRGMSCVNQTWLQCVNKMGKTKSKPLAAQYGRGTALALHGMYELAFTALHVLAMRLASSAGGAWQV
jgi:hypothetical protein